MIITCAAIKSNYHCHCERYSDNFTPTPPPTPHPRPLPTRPNLGVEVEIQDKWRIERMKRRKTREKEAIRGQEVCESGGSRPGIPVPMSLMVSVGVEQHSTVLRRLLVTVCP